MKNLIQMGRIAGLSLTLLLGASASDAAFRPLTLLFQGSVHGEITDCGCKSKPLGGVARRAKLIEGIKADQPSTLLLDGGNLFGKVEEPWITRTDLLVKETVALGYDVAGVGPWDLWHGPEFLAAAAQEGMQYTSVNLKHGGEFLFPRWLIQNHGGIQVGLISVADPDLLNPESPYLENYEGIEVLDPVATLREALPQMKAEGAELIVLLSNLKRGGTPATLARVGRGHGVDMVIEGYVTQALKTVRRVAGVPILAANNRGKFLGQADIIVNDAGDIDDLAWTLHELGLAMPEDEDIAGRVGALEKSIKADQQSR